MTGTAEKSDPVVFQAKLARRAMMLDRSAKRRRHFVLLGVAICCLQSPVAAGKPVLKTLHLKNRAGYVARMTVTWTINGQARSWRSGKTNLAYDKTLRLPANAKNVRLLVEASAVISWVDVYIGPVDFRKTAVRSFKCYATIFSPKYSLR